MREQLIFKVFLFGFFLNCNVTAQVYYPPATGSWATANADSLGWCSNYLDTLDVFLKENNSKSFIILKDGKIVYEQYYNGSGKDSLWYWASASKSLFAFLIGIAQEEGSLTIHDTMSHYLGNWTNCTAQEEEKVTIRHMLTMTNGFDGAYPYFSCLSDTCLNCIALPGTRWDYHNSPYTIAHELLEMATNQNLNMFTWSRVATPIGMGGLWFRFSDYEIYLSTARGMARFGLLALSKGVWDGDTLLKDTLYLRDMLSPSQNINESYGYLWWLNGQSSYMLPGSQIVYPGRLNPNAPADAYGAMGKNEQRIYVVPSEGLVITRAGNAANGGSQNALAPFDEELWEILNKLRCSAISLPEEELKKWQVVPNPVHSHLSLPRNCIYTIYSVAGERVKDGRSNLESVDVRDLRKGFYILHIEGYQQLKFLKY